MWLPVRNASTSRAHDRVEVAARATADEGDNRERHVEAVTEPLGDRPRAVLGEREIAVGDVG